MPNICISVDLDGMNLLLLLSVLHLKTGVVLGYPHGLETACSYCSHMSAELFALVANIRHPTLFTPPMVDGR